MGEQKTEMCPCIDAHRRLMDLHEDIHRVVNNYLDANEFRRFLNSAIQNSRGVSFLVQKRKAKWADFGEWYGAWQAVAKQNPVMGWGVASRNRIVKEEDLLTLSQAVLSLFDERLQVAEDVVTVPPSTSVDEMVAVFADFIAKQPSQKQRWIRVQRRWVDDQLPQYELVSALRELYAGVSELVRLTHEVSDVTSCNAPPFARSCVDATFNPELACLGPGDPLPSAVIDARTGRATQMEYGIIKADAAMMKLGETRYGLIPRRGQTAVEYAAGQMDLFKRFLEVDGSAGGVLLLFRGREEMRISPVMFPKTTPRELVVASTVEIQGAWQFDGGLFAGEMWLTPPNHGGARGSMMGVTADDLLPPDEDLYDPDPLGGREEALIVQAVQSDGSSRVLVQPFARTRRGIVYGPLMDDDTGTWLTPFLRPIWRRWPKWNGWTPGPRG